MRVSSFRVWGKMVTGRLFVMCVLFIMGAFVEGHAEEKSFVIVIPSYNNKEWYERNLGSALFQEYHNFRIIYIDDASTDGTGDLVKAYIKEWDRGNRVTFIRNQERRGSLSNTYLGVWQCRPHEIVAILDGDDWFAHAQVLQKLNTVYSDPDVWASYGQLRYYPCGFSGWEREIPAEIIQKNEIRHQDWKMTHLKTFYAGLFHKIDIQDLFYDHQFFSTAGDLAYAWPVMEMAGVHSHFISDVLYIYNVASPLNDSKVNSNLQMYFTSIIRAKRHYDPVESPY